MSMEEDTEVLNLESREEDGYNAIKGGDGRNEGTGIEMNQEKTEVETSSK